MKFFISFDIDGTLIKFGGASKNHPIAFSQAFSEILEPIGLPEQFLGKNVDGKTDFWLTKEIVRKITQNEDISLVQKIKQRISDIYEEFDQPPNLVPGAERLLSKLSSMENVTLGISSGNFESIGWRKLQITNLLPYFPNRICGMGDFDTRIEALNDSREHAVQATGSDFDCYIHVGDTYNDVESARKAGYFPIAVNSGRVKIESDGKPMLIVDDYDKGYDDIISLVSK